MKGAQPGPSPPALQKVNKSFLTAWKLENRSHATHYLVETRTVSIKGNSVFENFAELFIKCSIAPDHKSEGCTEFLQEHGPQTTSPLSSFVNSAIDTLVVDDKITKLPARSTTVGIYPSGSSFPSISAASGSQSIMPSQTPVAPGGQLSQQTGKVRISSLFCFELY
jgi:hypothetical protein